ncbi:hypothetical protein [Pedobacter panaciterrae]|uniref:hypothetical protein n=1 Tax=Pedobacter panaciterrae TaxID=363849 RepID=UPI002591C703|nr:hypothetical protein [uncultured Pedobacter sp.]
MEILIFRTTVDCRRAIDDLSPSFNGLLAVIKWSFDLEDCDRILRVEAASDISKELIGLLQSKGFECEVLPYEL